MNGRMPLPLLMVGGAYLLFFNDDYRIVVGYFFVCGIIVLARNKSLQERLDVDAWRQLEDRGARAFVLYLRPFSIDNRMRKRSLSVLAVLFGGFGFTVADRKFGNALTSEQELEGEIRDFGMDFIAVREPDTGRSEGAGSIRLEGNWKTSVCELMKRSKAILYVGGNTPGAVYELDQILMDEALTEKSILIAPGYSAHDKQPEYAPRSAVVKALEQWGFKYSGMLEDTKFALRRMGGAFVVVEWQGTKKAVSSLHLRAMIESLDRATLGPATLKIRPSLPFGLCHSHDLFEKSCTLESDAQNAFAGPMDLFQAFRGATAKDHSILDLLNQTYPDRISSYLALCMNRMKFDASTGPNGSIVISDAASSFLAQWLCCLGFLVPATRFHPLDEIEEGTGQFLLTPYGYHARNCLPLYQLLHSSVEPRRQTISISDDYASFSRTD